MSIESFLKFEEGRSVEMCDPDKMGGAVGGGFSKSKPPCAEYLKLNRPIRTLMPLYRHWGKYGHGASYRGDKDREARAIGWIASIVYSELVVHWPELTKPAIDTWGDWELGCDGLERLIRQTLIDARAGKSKAREVTFASVGLSKDKARSNRPTGRVYAKIHELVQLWEDEIEKQEI